MLTIPLISEGSLSLSAKRQTFGAGLESVRWAAEVVAADSDSTDNTFEICEEYGCQVFNHKFGKSK